MIPFVEYTSPGTSDRCRKCIAIWVHSTYSSTSGFLMLRLCDPRGHLLDTCWWNTGFLQSAFVTRRPVSLPNHRLCCRHTSLSWISVSHLFKVICRLNHWVKLTRHPIFHPLHFCLSSLIWKSQQVILSCSQDATLSHYTSESLSLHSLHPLPLHQA